MRLAETMPAPERYTPEQVSIYEQVRADLISYGSPESAADYTARGQAEGFEIPDPASVAKRTGKTPIEQKLDAAAAARLSMIIETRAGLIT